MQAAVVHDGGVGQDPPRKQKRLAFVDNKNVVKNK
jgi:hypothetical protein